jgi:hypothetical protein
MAKTCSTRDNIFQHVAVVSNMSQFFNIWQIVSTYVNFFNTCQFFQQVAIFSTCRNLFNIWQIISTKPNKYNDKKCAAKVIGT